MGRPFPAIKSRTANLRMLSAAILENQPFSSLPDLGASVEYRLSGNFRELELPEKKAWIFALSSNLQKVKLTDETQTKDVRKVAARLGRSFWQLVETINVTPYIDGAPAGMSHSPDVLWHGETLYVREGRIAKSYDALVSELARPFANESVTKAIKACIERDESFITEYMEEHFDLEDEIELVNGSLPQARWKPNKAGEKWVRGQ